MNPARELQIGYGMKKNRLRLVCLTMMIGASLVGSNSSPASGQSPASNATVAPMPAKVLGFDPKTKILQLQPTVNNATTILNYQQPAETHYIDAVSVAVRPAGLKTMPDTGGPSLLSLITGVALVVCGALGLIWVLLKRDS